MSEAGQHCFPVCDQGKLTEKIGSTGEYSVSGGVNPGMCIGERRAMRRYAGFATAEKSN
jgi:methylmalonyl-CoA mutase N-terminal domain/subunit